MNDSGTGTRATRTHSHSHPPQTRATDNAPRRGRNKCAWGDTLASFVQLRRLPRPKDYDPWAVPMPAVDRRYRGSRVPCTLEVGGPFHCALSCFLWRCDDTTTMVSSILQNLMNQWLFSQRKRSWNEQPSETGALGVGIRLQCRRPQLSPNFACKDAGALWTAACRTPILFSPLAPMLFFTNPFSTTKLSTPRCPHRPMPGHHPRPSGVYTMVPTKSKRSSRP